MSNVAKAFRTYLLTKSAVTGQVATRIYPDTLPQNARLPAARFTVISDNPTHHMTGGSAHTRARVQIDIYAATRLAADTASDNFRDAADGYRGAMGAEHCQMCHLETKQSFYEPPVDKGDQGRYGVTQDWLIAITETAPNL